MKIKIVCTSPKTNVFEINFYQDKTLLYSVSCDIEGKNSKKIFDFKQEAVTNFCNCFDLSKKDVLKEFSKIDPLMYKLYKETFNPKGAGRKAGKKIGKIKPKTVVFYRRVTLEEKEILEETLKRIKKDKK